VNELAGSGPASLEITSMPVAGAEPLLSLPSTIALEVLLYIPRLFFKKVVLRSRANPRVIQPGVAFSTAPMPEPLIPYGRIWERRCKRSRSH